MMEENEKHVEYSSKEEPEFIRDIIPTLQPWFALITIYTIYFYTGKLALGLWMIYMGRSIYDRYLLDDSTNINKKYEKAFSDYGIFKLPMYAYILT